MSLIKEYESEEKEVKNIEELKSWFEDEKLYVGEYVKHKINQLDEPEVKQLYEKISELESYNDELIRDNNQLRNEIDNQEVLSREWISENVEYAYFDMLDGSGRLSSATAIIKPEKLQNLLAPKQKLPVIPNYVAKWISEHHEKFDLYPALRRLEEGSTRDYDAYKWYRRNTHTFVNAYLTGEYEIEQEPKYYAKIKGHENIGSNDKYWNYNTDMEELSVGDSEVHPNVISEYVFKATKDEWANLGITDDNADFELVEELEEC